MNSPSDLLILAGKKKKSEHQCSWREEDFKGMVGEASRILRPDTPPSHVRGSQSHSTYGETEVWRPAPSRWELLSRFSRVRLCATPWTAAHQAPVPGLLRARTLGRVRWALGAAKERNFDPLQSGLYTQHWVKIKFPKLISKHTQTFTVKAPLGQRFFLQTLVEVFFPSN